MHCTHGRAVAVCVCGYAFVVRWIGVCGACMVCTESTRTSSSSCIHLAFIIAVFIIANIKAWLPAAVPGSTSAARVRPLRRWLGDAAAAEEEEAPACLG